MYNDVFGELENMNLDGVLGGLAIFIVILALIILAIAIILYVFQSIALSQLAKKNNMANPWMAWIPVANMYLLGKMGFEMYAPKEKRNEVFTWVLLGCSAASILLSDTSISGLITLALTVFNTWAYYYIFNKINNKNCVLYTVLTAIFGLGGIFLYCNRKNFVAADDVAPVAKTVVNEEVKEEKTEEKAKFCPTCGEKVNKTSKFCGKCGTQL